MENNWISVEDALPVISRQVNVWREGESVSIGHVWGLDENYKGRWSVMGDYIPTHWQLLPTPPKS